MPAPQRGVPAAALELIKRVEGIEDGDPSTVNLGAYLDPVGIWTIGWGHAIRDPQGAGRFGRRAARTACCSRWPV